MSHEGMMIKTTNGVAVMGLTLPGWWPSLEATSTVAAQMVPILSAVWLMVQIARFVSKWGNGKEDGAASRNLAIGSAAVLAIAAPFIASWEGRELRAYRDIVGVPTICYGETLGVRMGQTATSAQCDAMLARRVSQFAAEIAPCLPRALPPKTAAAFVSAAYNIGSPAFCRSSMSRRALAGDLRGACNALSLWVYAGGKRSNGLVNRRDAERGLCLEGLK